MRSCGHQVVVVGRDARGAREREAADEYAARDGVTSKHKHIKGWERDDVEQGEKRSKAGGGRVEDVPERKRAQRGQVPQCAEDVGDLGARGEAKRAERELVERRVLREEYDWRYVRGVIELA